jgi:hypothetical protein
VADDMGRFLAGRLREWSGADRDAAAGALASAIAKTFERERSIEALSAACARVFAPRVAGERLLASIGDGDARLAEIASRPGRRGFWPDGRAVAGSGSRRQQGHRVASKQCTPAAQASHGDSDGPEIQRPTSASTTSGGRRGE